MVFFISDPRSALGLGISARKPVGSRDNERSDIKGHVMIFLSYMRHKKTYPEMYELQCNTDYRKRYDIFWNRVIYIFFISAR